MNASGRHMCSLTKTIYRVTPTQVHNDKLSIVKHAIYKHKVHNSPWLQATLPLYVSKLSKHDVDQPMLTSYAAHNNAINN